MRGDLVEKVSKAESLPSLPAIAFEILSLTRSDEASAGDLARIIEKDPSFAAKILKMVNSPLYGLGRKTTSLKQAVALAGQRAIRVTALSMSLAEQINLDTNDGFDYQSYWRSSLTTAVAARLIANVVSPERAEEAFVAGLLSHIGRLAAHKVAPDDYAAVLKYREEHGGRLRNIEHKLLGVTSSRLGCELLRRWNLPEAICFAVRTSQGEELESLPEEFRDTALIVHAACIVSDLFCCEISASTLEQVKDVVMRCTGIDGEALETLLLALDDHVREAAHHMSLQIGGTADYAEIRANAAMELAQLTMQAEAERAATASRAEAAETRNKQLHEEKRLILEVAATDSLTKIGNRTAFDTRLKDAMHTASSTGQTVGLILLDIDHFKEFNDTHGHQAGDEVLREIADAIKCAVGRAGFAARYGGEEFGVIMLCDSPDDTKEMAEAVRSAIECRHVAWNGAILHVTASVGYATTTPSIQLIRCDQLVSVADECLYEAKRSGRNQVRPLAA